jgi:hypothetical protein
MAFRSANLRRPAKHGDAIDIDGVGIQQRGQRFDRCLLASDLLEQSLGSGSEILVECRSGPDVDGLLLPAKGKSSNRAQPRRYRNTAFSDGLQRDVDV